MIAEYLLLFVLFVTTILILYIVIVKGGDGFSVHNKDRVSLIDTEPVNLRVWIEKDEYKPPVTDPSRLLACVNDLNEKVKVINYFGSVAAVVAKWYLKGDNVYCEFSFLNTPAGQEAHRLLYAGHIQISAMAIYGEAYIVSREPDRPYREAVVGVSTPAFSPISY